jgi:peptidyl-prolyl cis-trans isomerase-like protein 2
MGKKQHQKDRAYLTATEWRTEWGGFKDKKALPFKRLPFHCCAITFTPFEEPVCGDDGVVMDVVNAVPYVMKYKRHPITGAPMQLKDLTTLHFHKNSDGACMRAACIKTMLHAHHARAHGDRA